MTIAQAAPGLKPKLTIGGAPATEQLMQLMTELVLDDSVSLPDMLELTFADYNSGFLETSPFEIGVKVGVELTAPGQPPSKFEGECVSIGACYHGGKFQATIRAFDISHRLNRGRLTKTYESSADSDIFRKIVGDAGMRCGTVVNTTPSPRHRSVVNEVPLAFLRRLAAENGLEAVAADGKMHFRKPGGTGEPVTLNPGGSLLSLDAEISATGQVKEVEVGGWDTKLKKAITATSDVTSNGTKIPLTPADISTKMGTTKKLVIGDMPIDTLAHATAVAKATAEQHGSAFVDVRGTASGHTGLRAGGKIKLEGVGKAFKGEYVLSNTRHSYSKPTGYVTEFTVSGQQDRSLGGLVQGMSTGSDFSLSGVVSGVVTDNKDSDNAGRVRVAFPWLDTEHVSGWARVLFPGGGPGRGISFMPEVGDEVLVAFEHGDPAKPLILGGLINGKDKIPDHKGASHFSRGKVHHYGIHTDSCHIAIADKPGDECMTMGLRDKSYLISTDKKGTTVKIKSDGKVEVMAAGAVTINAGGKIEIKSDADISIKGLNVAIEAQSELKLTANGPASLKGAMVKIG